MHALKLDPATVQALWEPASQIVASMTQDILKDIPVDQAIPRHDARIVALDPMTIMAIIAAIVQVVQMFQVCKTTPAAAVAQAQSTGMRGLMLRWQLRTVINHHIDDPKIKAVLGSHPVTSIMSYTAALSVPDAEKIFAAVK